VTILVAAVAGGSAECSPPASDGKPPIPPACPQWVNILYHDMAVFIRDEGPTLSSSSMPSIMGTMLDLLRVEGGSTVLEIGTGSGYNAALLCHGWVRSW
jgi:hypothetical protein